MKPLPALYIIPYANGDPGVTMPTAQWTATPLPSGTQGLAAIEQDHAATQVSFEAQAGVIPLPHLLSLQPVGSTIAAALAAWGVAATDRTFDVIQKAYTAGNVQLPWELRCPTTALPAAITAQWTAQRAAS